MKKDVIGYCMVLLGGLLFSLTFFLSNNSVGLTGNFFANDGTSHPIFINSFNVDSYIVSFSYSINDSYFDSEEASIDIWIVNTNYAEIRRVKDSFFKDNSVSREISFNLNAEPTGIYSLYLAPDFETGNYIRHDFVIGRSSTTGFAVLDEPGNKMIAYGIFLLIIAIGIFFIVWNNLKDDDLNSGKRKKKVFIEDED